MLLYHREEQSQEMWRGSATMEELFNIFGNLGSLILWAVLIRLLIFIIEIAVFILIVRLICQYQAKENARAFDYEYLAQCIAEEIRSETIQGKFEHSENNANGNSAS